MFNFFNSPFLYLKLFSGENLSHLVLLSKIYLGIPPGKYLQVYFLSCIKCLQSKQFSKGQRAGNVRLPNVRQLEPNYQRYA